MSSIVTSHGWRKGGKVEIRRNYTKNFAIPQLIEELLKEYRKYKEDLDISKINIHKWKDEIKETINRFHYYLPVPNDDFYIIFSIESDFNDNYGKEDEFLTMKVIPASWKK